MLNTKPALKEGFTLRAPTLDDAPGVLDLMNACALKVIGRTDDTLEDILGDWQSPGLSLETDYRVLTEPDGRIIGYALVMDHVRPVAPFVDMYMHPDYWGDPMIEVLLAWTEERARKALDNPDVPADAQVVMQAATYDNDTYYKAVLQSADMTLARLQWRMQIDLDSPPPSPELPEGITIRSINPDEDKRPLLMAIRDAWRDHWGYVERPFEEHYTRWLHDWEDDYDPSLWYMAMDDGQIVGFSLCKPRYGDDEDMGWVGTLGVIRSHRKSGIGMALLQHSFGELYKRGKRKVGLGVDAGSLTGATRLYQRAGMRVMIQIEVYEKELRPGIDYRTQSIEP
jgi:mycothiol synthase